MRIRPLPQAIMSLPPLFNQKQAYILTYFLPMYLLQPHSTQLGQPSLFTEVKIVTCYLMWIILPNISGNYLGLWDLQPWIFGHISVPDILFLLWNRHQTQSECGWLPLFYLCQYYTYLSTAHRYYRPQGSRQVRLLMTFSPSSLHLLEPWKLVSREDSSWLVPCNFSMSC